MCFTKIEKTTLFQLFERVPKINEKEKFMEKIQESIETIDGDWFLAGDLQCVSGPSEATPPRDMGKGDMWTGRKGGTGGGDGDDDVDIVGDVS